MRFLLLLIALASIASAQTTGQYVIPRKNAGAGYSNVFVSPSASSIFVWDGSLNPSSIQLSTVARTNAANTFSGNQAITGTVSATAGVFDALTIADGTLTFATDSFSYEGTAAASHRAALIPNGSLSIDQIDLLQTTLDGKANLTGGNTITGAQTIEHSANPVLDLRRTTVATNSLAATATLTGISSGDVTDGFGPSLGFRISDTGVSNNLIGGLAFERAGSDSTGEFVVRNQIAGSATERLRITSTALVLPTNAKITLPRTSFGAVLEFGGSNQLEYIPNNILSWKIAGAGIASFRTTGLVVASSKYFGATSADTDGTIDTTLGRASAGVWEMGAGGIHSLRLTHLTASGTITGANVILSPSASVTPANNGNLVVEATNNTTLTFRFKGSDGTVRSGTITLTP